MSRLFYLTIIIITMWTCQSGPKVYSSYLDYPVYEGDDLGLSYSKEKSTFKLWAPAADEVRIKLYDTALGGVPTMDQSLQARASGVWEASFPGDLKGQYYAFQTKNGGVWGSEVPDPYAKAVGTNGQRGMIIDLKSTNPEGWEKDQRPPLAGFNDIILYELHVRDVSMDPNSGIQNKGKFLGLAETGTKSADGAATGLDHIKELGVTHVHLLPSYDFLSIDETKLEDNKYNWGYDPQHYNTPEGSYSTNPTDGAIRIKEFKQLIKTLHENGIRVIMDVVYNHTGATEQSNFNQLVPGYYYRQNEEGGFSNASACGNETASERPMMRKFIVESVKYWAQEYHIDGFRFDLMGIHDITTMNAVTSALDAIDPSLFVYGEGWTAGASPLPDSTKAIKANVMKLDRVAAFSDDIRDAIKGHVFTHDAKAFVSGLAGMEESLKFGIVASTQHAQVNYDSVNYSKAPWAKSPLQTITYASCHDNHTLWDRLTISCPDETEAERIKMHKLAATIVLTSQGVPFLHAGVEMLRTKNGVENSFESPDEINRIDWARKSQYAEVVNYFKALIQLRKSHPAFRMMTTSMVQEHLHFLEVEGSNLVAYTLSGNANGDSWKNILVVYNGNADHKTLTIPAGPWQMVLDGNQINPEGLENIEARQITIPGRTAMILKQS
ncbi:MAG: type I pullulanase [Saprospiraceae bacterium]